MRQRTPDHRGTPGQRQEVPDHLLCCARLKFSWIVRCSRRSKVERAGFGFCGIHDPGPDVTPEQAANLSAVEQPPKHPA
jgi:hypothetical protein